MTNYQVTAKSWAHDIVTETIEAPTPEAAIAAMDDHLGRLGWKPSERDGATIHAIHAHAGGVRHG